jgi:hypothetical protein
VDRGGVGRAAPLHLGGHHVWISRRQKDLRSVLQETSGREEAYLEVPDYCGHDLGKLMSLCAHDFAILRHAQAVGCL